MSEYREFVISPKELQCQEQIPDYCELEQDKKSTILCRLLDSDYMPLVNASVQVFKIDYNYKPSKVIDLGYVTTNKDGEFAISVKQKCGVFYKFEVYEPLYMGCDSPWQ